MKVDPFSLMLGILCCVVFLTALKAISPPPRHRNGIVASRAFDARNAK